MTVTLSPSSIFAAPGAVPRFSAFDPAEVVPAIRAALAQAEASLSERERAAADVPSTVAGAVDLLASLERLEDPLGWAWGLANHLLSVRTSDALRAAIEEVQPEVVTLFSRLGQSRPLHDALVRLSGAVEASAEAPPAIQRALALALRAARHTGVALDGEARDRFNANQQELARLALLYSNAVLDATRAFALTLTSEDEVAGLPPSARALYAQQARAAGHADATADAGPWRVGIDFASFGPFLEYAERRDLREQLHRAYVGRAGPDGDPERDNAERIAAMLRLRQEQAELLGFPTFAAMQLDTRMAPDVAAVTRLLDALYTSSHPAALREHAELSAFAAEHGFGEPLRQWDVAYWARRLREARYSWSDEDLRPYLPLPAVLDGLFGIVERAFGVRITPRAASEVEVWHPDVRYFDVHAVPTAPGLRSELVAGFFLDPYSRPEDKRGGAWMNECVGRSRALAPEGATHRVPVAYLVCNQSPPVDGRPSLMTWNEVTTLFHEMGHGLQHMLTEVDVGPVAGIMGVEWDAIELPSQFMENWLRHKPTVATFARHWQTGALIPEPLLDRVLAASTFRAGSGFLRQLSFARLDMALHDGFAPTPERDIWHLQREVLTTHGVLPPLPHDRFLCAFGHLFGGGYAAGYYAYKWAEVLSADAFAAFEEAGLDDEVAVRTTGQRFRETVLGLGGSVPPAEVFRRFRGRDPDPQALLRHNGLAAA
jgi:oligopeptidase A